MHLKSGGLGREEREEGKDTENWEIWGEKRK